ncbi:MAG: protein kinase [Deltaproteobacteria bacterium]|nr:MAG: protein kinase [Deltaproteobacteria bacterium]
MGERLVTDTTNFFSIDYGDVILVDQKRYRVTGHERERRFGMDDPKFWVKKAVDLETGEKKIIKLSYFESFDSYLSGIKIRRFRNPEKEGQVLELVRNHPYFMHGTVYRDIKGNNVRVLDIVHGINLLRYISSIKTDHATYFRKFLPGILKNLVRAFEAIRFLHINGLKHGDIRNDHIIVEQDSGNYVWIDFDYDYEASENPYGLDVFGMGNILIYSIGMGFHTHHNIEKNPDYYSRLIGCLEAEDYSILDKARFINLKKLYPYIPGLLNDILMHFSRGANVYYEFAEEIIEDLNRCIYTYF